MDVIEALDAMRSEIPGVSLVAYADLGSRIVLGASAVSKPAQEELDRLSELAQVMLDGAVAEGAQPLVKTGADDAVAGAAMLLSGRDAKVFLRSSGDAPEALVCVCAPEADLRKVVDCGRSTLGTIVAET